MKTESFVAFVLIALLCGCSSSHQASQRSVGRPPDSDPALASGPSPGTTWTVWHLKSSSPTSSTITVIFDNDLQPYPSCTVPTRSVTRETPTTVSIGLVAPAPIGFACAAPGIRTTFTIHLKAPLGSRRIVRLISPAAFEPELSVPRSLPPDRRLSMRDISLVDAVSSALTTTPGAGVEVWRGTGREVWHALNPRARTTASKQVWLGNHELLLVVCTDHPNGVGHSMPPGWRPPAIGEVEVVIDETEGREIETRYIPLGPNESTIPAPRTLVGLGEPTHLIPPPLTFN